MKIEGMTDAKARERALAAATYEAQDITTNFSRHGAYTKRVDSVIPYLNATVQGLDRFYRAMVNPDEALTTAQRVKIISRAFLKAMVLISSVKALMAIAFSDDEEYQNTRRGVKDTNMVIPAKLFFEGDDRVLRIPLPQGPLCAFFGGGVERMIN